LKLAPRASSATADEAHRLQSASESLFEAGSI